MQMKLLLASTVLLAAATNLALAQSDPPSYKRDVPAKLAHDAKISEDAARAAALSKVPRGQVVALELERERSKLLYSFDLKVPGRSGIDEVHVNAMDGLVLSVEHESVKTERAEAAADKKSAAKKK